MALPVRISVGRSNIRAADISSGAELGRELKKGFDQFAKDFAWYTNQLVNALPEDMIAALESTFELTQERVPVDTGELKGSGYLEQVPFRNGVRVELGYGKNGDPDYAIQVHEVPHQHAEPTAWKFVENPINEDYWNIIQRVTDRIKARTGT